MSTSSRYRSIRKDDTPSALVDGSVKFENGGGRRRISVYPVT